MVIGDKGEIQEKKKEIINHRKDGPTKTKKTKWTQVLQNTRKRRVKYISNVKGEKEEGRGSIHPKTKWFIQTYAKKILVW